MQPENSRNSVPGLEQMPMPPVVTPEGVPQLPPLETGVEQGQERVEQAAEAGARAADAAASAVPIAPVMPQMPPAQTAQPENLGAAGTPLVAADEDLIEKEWVDKAKEIVDQTQGDPYTRTQRVNELQRDYLKKRYGKVIGADE